MSRLSDIDGEQLSTKTFKYYNERPIPSLNFEINRQSS